jgi:predicted MFS family arabinose efflux permease
MAAPLMAAPTPMIGGRSERAIIFLVAAVQFINILDFVIVLPLGPMLARSLDIPASHLGFVGGSYTAAAAVAGLIGAQVLERFDRRIALGAAMLGLVAGTALGGFATGAATLYAARVIAGFFGGPATSLSFSIVADVIPPARRGKAVGAMMGAFSVASVAGVPLGLWLAETYGWRAPFFAVAGLGLVVNALAIFLLPPMRMHMEASKAQQHRVSTRELLSRPTVQISYLMTAVVMMAGFIVIPNIPTYLLGNVGMPATDLKWMYLMGGVVSFITLRVMGRLVDRYGSFRVGLFGSIWVVAVTWFLFYDFHPEVPLALLFIFFMMGMGSRNVAYNTLTTKVPGPTERAKFQSIQSSVQHAASALGAFLSSFILSEVPLYGPDGAPLLSPDGKQLAKLVGMPKVALVSITLTFLVPPLLYFVETRVRGSSPVPQGVKP